MLFWLTFIQSLPSLSNFAIVDASNEQTLAEGNTLAIYAVTDSVAQGATVQNATVQNATLQNNTVQDATIQSITGQSITGQSNPVTLAQAPLQGQTTGQPIGGQPLVGQLGGGLLVFPAVIVAIIVLLLMSICAYTRVYVITPNNEAFVRTGALLPNRRR